MAGTEPCALPSSLTYTGGIQLSPRSVERRSQIGCAHVSHVNLVHERYAAPSWLPPVVSTVRYGLSLVATRPGSSLNSSVGEPRTAGTGSQVVPPSSERETTSHSLLGRLSWKKMQL